MAADRQRLFFALWPPPSVRVALAHEPFCGRRVAPQRLHLTLLFLGDVTTDKLPALRAATTSVATPAFTLWLSRLGHFPGAKVTWAAPAPACACLDELHNALRAAAASAGWFVQSRGFRPHVTLARRSAPPARTHLARPLPWRVRAFSLAVSERGAAGAAYRSLAQWPLRDDEATSGCME